MLARLFKISLLEGSLGGQNKLPMLITQPGSGATHWERHPSAGLKVSVVGVAITTDL